MSVKKQKEYNKRRINIKLHDIQTSEYGLKILRMKIPLLS